MCIWTPQSLEEPMKSSAGDVMLLAVFIQAAKALSL